uniref:CCHC-type domain-containing protein n=1 Tax=Tanacetum cinerariifolium TaxID=118510 RepID=A0A6L2LH48_TANCI|nr:hypothetical protein [Tanacetum cinerariifolium]
MQTHTSNALHNVIMEAGGKDRPPMLAPGIDNDIYSIVDAFPNACEMWKAIERLKQCESINVQDLETNLYWEFGKFTSRDGESLESYYSRFYKMMNELVKNQCNSQELKTVSYHKLYDILKQHQNEVNKIRAERLARKAIVNSPPPIYDQEPTMVAEDDEMSKDKEIDKLIVLISLSFKKIYKPTNNNLRTSSNTSIANQDNSLRINKGTGYDNQRIVNVVGARENVGTPMVQQSGIQYYNCKEYGHVARECQKPKQAKDAAYHKENMLLCKQEEAGFQLNAEQADWRDDTDDEPEDQELEAHYMYMAQIQEVTLDAADNSRPIFDSEPLQKVSNNDNYNVFAIESEYLEQSKSANDVDQDDDDNDDDDLANEQMKKELFAHQETISIMSQEKAAQIKFYKTREDKEIDKVIALENKVKVLDNIVYKTGQSVQTMNMLNRNCKTSFAKPKFLKKAQSTNPRLYDLGFYDDNLALML